MKEICAVIRRDKLLATKEALADLGYPSVSIQSVDGRGRQRGDIACSLAGMDEDGRTTNSLHVKLKSTPSSYALEHTLPKVALFVPKRMLTLVVPDEVVGGLVAAIIAVNQTGEPGDGRVFVCPIEEAVRVRTDERDAAAIA